MSKLALRLVAAILPVLLASCSDLPSAPQPDVYLAPPTFGERDSVFADFDLRCAIYSSYAGPPEFFTEDHTQTFPSYMTTWRIHAPGMRESLANRELSTDDPAEARAWADSTIAYSNGLAPLGATQPRITERYIELKTAMGSGRYSLGLRAHRASYLADVQSSWSGVDGPVGSLRVRPIDGNAARGVAEYLWYLGHTASSRRVKVLTSYSIPGSGGVLHVIYAAALERDPVARPGNEKIALIRTEYRIDGLSGDIALHTTFVRTIKARPSFALELRPLPEWTHQ